MRAGHHCAIKENLAPEWVSIFITSLKPEKWELIIHCNDDMDNIKLEIKNCPYCGLELKSLQIPNENV